MVDRSDLLNDYARIIDELRAENAELRKDRETFRRCAIVVTNMREVDRLNMEYEYGIDANSLMDRIAESGVLDEDRD